MKKLYALILTSIVVIVISYVIGYITGLVFKSALISEYPIAWGMFVIFGFAFSILFFGKIEKENE